MNRYRASIFVLIILTMFIGSGAGRGPQTIDIAFHPYGTIRWERGTQPVLLVTPSRGDGWITIARRFSGTSETVGAIRRVNPRLRVPLRDRFVRIPVTVLRGDLRLEAVRRLFPTDSRITLGWQHRVLDPFRGNEENWDWLAETFTGSADRASELKAANPKIFASGLNRDLFVVIPGHLLLSDFRSLAPVATPTPKATKTPFPRSSAIPTPINAARRASTLLDYGSDRVGEYAIYRLKKGEALYSAVVVRFTGQLVAENVNETALEIASRSGIDDVTGIPVGYPIKIPLDLVLPEHLPLDHPQRLAWDEETRELGRFFEVVHATDLTGVHVILDAGHGGNDSGAVVSGVWEATYVFDIMCRIKKNLEQHTRATVWTTIEDTRNGCLIVPNDRLEQNRGARLLTTPRYRLEDSGLGVNLRWYLTNDIILNRLGSSVPRSKTVFLSIHADSLHSSVRGAMAYVPSRHLRPTEPFTVKRKDIQKYAEYRNHPTVRFGTEFKAKVEASSRHMAGSIISSLERNEIGIHPYEPVRDRVLRGRRRNSYVPAVLRYTAAQNAVLLECCNMGNAKDRSMLLKQEWRERFSRSVVEGMATAFSN